VVCVKDSTTERVAYEWVEKTKHRFRTTWVDSFLRNYEPIDQKPVEEIIKELREAARQGYQTLLAPDQVRTLLRHLESPRPPAFAGTVDEHACTAQCQHSSFNSQCGGDV
jgi:hypothetical protein